MGTAVEKIAGNKTSLYERDYHAWLEQQARLLRSGLTGQLDVANLIEEIEDMGRSEEAKLQSALEQALLHLVKLAYSPAVDPRRGWRTSVVKQRVDVEKLLRRNPGLQSKIDNVFQETWPGARKIAIAELAEHGEPPSISENLPFMLQEVRDESFWPKAINLASDPD